MSIVSSLSKYGITSVYHFTDESNLKSIEKYGIQSLKNIAKYGINVSRFGAENLSHILDMQKGLDRYVHLAFVDDHPMYYVAKSRGSIIRPVWLEIDISILNNHKTRFCDKVANQTNANIFYLDRVLKNIDFANMVHGNSFEARKEARKAEILAYDHIDISMIKGVYYGK